jgi:hypothetical protein
MIGKSESSLRSTSGENKDMGKWRLILCRFSNRRWVRDNLYGMHKMRPYDSGRKRFLSSLWEGLPWRKEKHQPQNSVNRRASRAVRTRANIRSRQRAKRSLRSSYATTARAYQRLRYSTESADQSGAVTQLLRQRSDELAKLIERENRNEGADA